MAEFVSFLASNSKEKEKKQNEQVITNVHSHQGKMCAIKEEGKDEEAGKERRKGEREGKKQEWIQQTLKH